MGVLVNLPLGYSLVLAARRALVENRAAGRRRVARRARRGMPSFRAGPFDAGIDQGPGLGWASLPTSQVVLAAAVAMVGYDELTAPPGTDGRAHCCTQSFVAGTRADRRRGQRRLLRLSADARAVPQLRLGLHAAGLAWPSPPPRWCAAVVAAVPSPTGMVTASSSASAR